ncbi:DUF3108 domain-containing protein [Simiduia agarivorans]|uniref:DUF3108 domain-containing protein n=1 Tax=Simiduia agarivorans (strain DSM 21679 / JCM 13881 / BCRC 17597 / SA1) TaxID=1117647 RepID=K4KWM1_SIMAS|nr:DUF3108 domain-containing protein [Simiduia agarivorans]AFU98327.1 hypothetical protein M5M_05610 [Simiduia agarivorans SA1 = DSM 21679]
MTLKQLRGIVLLICLGPLVSHAQPVADTPMVAPAEAQPVFQLPKPFKAIYKTRLYGIKLTATRELVQQEDGRWFLRFDIESWVAGLKERSQFEWGQDGKAFSHHYEFHRTGLAPDRHMVVDFNWEKYTATNTLNKEPPWTMEIPDGTLDKLNATMQIRADLKNGNDTLVYSVADGGKLKKFRFAIDREETIDTPVGKLETVVVKTLRKNKKRETYSYFAKDWDYVLVRISQKEPNGDSATVDIQQGWVDGEPIKGR